VHQNAYSWKVLVVDVAETPIERPKKQRRYYSGKKKRHTLKAQIMMHQTTGQILCTAFTNKGSQCQGKLHPYSCTPT